MEVELAKSLQSRIDACMRILRSSYEVLKEQAEIFQKAEKEVFVWQQALETETKNSETPYVRLRVPQLNFSFNGTFETPDEHQSTTQGNSNEGFAVPNPPLKKKGKRLDVSNKSPTGVLRQVFLSFNGATVSIEDLLKKIPTDLTFEITRDDVYRIIPRMLKRGELVRQATGVYRYVGDELAEVLGIES